MSFEEAFCRILRAKERGKPEKRGRAPRKMDLGDTRAGRSVAVGFVEPVRVPVPDEFLEPQPYMARNILDRPTSEGSRMRKRHGRRASDIDFARVDAKR